MRLSIMQPLPPGTMVARLLLFSWPQAPAISQEVPPLPPPAPQPLSACSGLDGTCSPVLCPPCTTCPGCLFPNLKTPLEGTSVPRRLSWTMGSSGKQKNFENKIGKELHNQLVAQDKQNRHMSDISESRKERE